MQVLEENGERNTDHGRKTFAILLFQDLAIVPLLLLVQLLAPAATEIELAEALSQVGIAVAAIAILIATGRFLLDPMTHRMLSKLNARDALWELSESRRVIADQLGTAPGHFAYPYGEANQREFKLATEAGYQTAVTTVNGVIGSKHCARLTALPRIMKSPQPNQIGRETSINLLQSR